MKLSFKARSYIFFLAIIAIFFLIKYMPLLRVNEPQLFGIGAFIVLSMFSEYFDVTLPYVGMISVTYAIDFALIIAFDIPIAITVSCLGYLGSCLLKAQKEKISLIKVCFNLSQFIITITISGTVYHTLSATFPSGTGYLMLNLVIVALTYFALNMSLVNFLFAILKNRSFLSAWAMNIRWAVPIFLTLAPTGYILAYIYTDLHILGILVFFLPLLLARHSFKQYIDMREIYLRTIQSLASTIDAKDHYTAGHSQRVALYSVSIAEEMGFFEESIENLRHIALLHDIGKISVSETILNKPRCLAKDELTVMKDHVNVGYDIVKQIHFLKHPEYLKHHHEQWDGEGYPDGLKGEEIPIGARIIAVADSFDAMTSDRPYRKGMDTDEAMNELIRCRGSQFDPQVVDAFCRAFPHIKDIRFKDYKNMNHEEITGG
jgi:putative nucleotidyltransferase with HDIG domain